MTLGKRNRAITAITHMATAAIGIAGSLILESLEESIM